jgi:hypothetical protein
MAGKQFAPTSDMQHGVLFSWLKALNTDFFHATTGALVVLEHFSQLNGEVMSVPSYFLGLFCP